MSTPAPIDGRDAIRPAVLGPLHGVHAEASRCIQCGFCLPACPTYKVFGQEKHSPRGRIQLVKSWAEGKTALEADLLAALDLCLDCRACETACPIDVRYGEIITGARDELADGRASGEIGGLVARLRHHALKLVLRHIVAKPRRIRFFGKLTHRLVHGRLGRRLDKAARRRPDSWFGSAYSFARAIPRPLPPKTPAPPEPPVATGTSTTASGVPQTDGAPASATSKRDVVHRRRAVLFLGCAQEGLFPETNRATYSLLQRAGFDVEIPAAQRCCGALHRHNGDKDFARRLVLQNLHAFGAFEEGRADDIIAVNAGGCLAWMKEAARLFPVDSAEYRAANRMAERARDISEIIFETGLSQDLERVDTTATAAPTSGNTDENADIAHTAHHQRAHLRVVYQPSCHLKHVCGIDQAPLELLKHVHSGRATLPPDGGSCCASAGIYNALHPAESHDILDQKMDSIVENPPDVIVTSNPGCHLQMLAGVQARGIQDRVRVSQLADWLNEHKEAIPPLGRAATNRR